MKIFKVLLFAISLVTILCCGKEDASTPCEVNCQNGGQCYENACLCPDGYTGSDCSEVINDCDSPCQNGGTCNPNTGNCDCPPNYEGPQCQFEVVSCAGTACVNGQLNSNCDCICNSGWQGADCSVPVPTIVEFWPRNGGYFYVAPWIVSGDNDYHAGIRVNCTVELERVGRKIYLKTDATFIPFNSNDNTRGAFNSTVQVWEIPQGYDFVQFQTSTLSRLVNYHNQTGYAENAPFNSTLVNDGLVRGDTWGDDLPCNESALIQQGPSYSRSFVMYRLNPIKVKLVEQ